MTKPDVVNRLKTQRSSFRQDIIKGVQESIVLAARGGHFPNFDTISKQIMSGISDQMSECPDISREEWVVMLQEKEPDKFCEATMSILEESCPKE